MDALFAKAQRYSDEMLSTSRDEWQFALWSTLSLELLARAALARISPVLLADGKDWNNLLYGLGLEPKATKFIPRSIEISVVFSRLRELVVEFAPELEGFCLSHMSRRNEELHTGDTPLDTIKNSAWLPGYYRACDVLLKSLGESLEGFLGKEEAKVASELISAAADESAKAVKKALNAHEVVWAGKEATEKEELTTQAATWATRMDGHRVVCPACGCRAIVTGAPIAAPIKKMVDDEITETQQYLPSRFECIACGLKISGLSQLAAAGLGDAYSATFVYDAAEYYASEKDDEYSGYEPDFNEPM